MADKDINWWRFNIGIEIFVKVEKKRWIRINKGDW